MGVRSTSRILITLGLFFIMGTATAQNVEIKLGRNSIALNEVFQITLTVHNTSLKSRSDFPSISNFQDAGTSNSSSTQIINGRRTSSISVIQSFKPTKQGTFKLPPFSMTVNGKKYTSPGTTITVGPAKKSQPRTSNRWDPFDDPFFNRRRPNYDFKDVEDDAFLGVTVDKSEVYVGEGVLVNVAFFAKRMDYQFLDFPQNLGDQILEILQKLKIPQAWTEDFEYQPELRAERVVLDGVEFFKVKLAEVMVFPQAKGELVIPSLKLGMTKYKSAGVQNVWGQMVKGDGDEKVFRSKKKRIKVKDLPPHPLKDVVAVGQFSLTETISDTAIDISESFIYRFNVRGRGNINVIQTPTTEKDKGLTFFKPKTQQNTQRAKGTIYGNKHFTYDVIPDDPGIYNLEDLVTWIYFDPKKETYDTLKATKTIRVLGEAKTNAEIASTDLGSFYNLMETASNDITTDGEDEWMKIFANTLIFAMFAAIIILVVLSRRRRKEDGQHIR